MSWRIDPSKTAVAIIDVQDRLIPAISGGPLIVAKVEQLARIASLFQLPIFVTEQVPKKLGQTAPSVRAAIPHLAPVEKSAFSAAPALPKDMPRCVLVAGIETHVCVRQNVYDLRVRGHDVRVLADATGSRSPADHDIALQELRSDRVLITSVEATAWELLGSSDHPLFRPAMAILK